MYTLKSRIGYAPAAVLTVAVVLLAAAAAAPSHPKARCGTPDLNSTEAALRQISLDKRIQTARLSGARFVPRVVNVVWWVIRHSDGRGALSQAAIDASIRVLNVGFKGTGYSFVLQEVRSITNDDYFTAGLVFDADGNPIAVNPNLDNMKSALYNQLNVPATTLRVFSSQPDSLLGIATFPGPETRTTALPLDGVVIDWTSVPGGSAINFNLGGTLVHETGHWFYCFHTFQGGCGNYVGGQGDHVSDTPSEQSPNTGSCTAAPNGQPRDTCPDRKGDNSIFGPDPVNNFMDYSFDQCLSTFTPGQVERMQAAWITYREDLPAVCGSDNDCPPTATECLTRHCVGGQCAFEGADMGTPCTTRDGVRGTCGVADDPESYYPENYYDDGLASVCQEDTCRTASTCADPVKPCLDKICDKSSNRCGFRKHPVGTVCVRQENGLPGVCAAESTCGRCVPGTPCNFIDTSKKPPAGKGPKFLATSGVCEDATSTCRLPVGAKGCAIVNVNDACTTGLTCQGSGASSVCCQPTAGAVPKNAKGKENCGLCCSKKCQNGVTPKVCT